MFPWFLCFFSTPPSRTLSELEAKSNLWWNPTETVQALNDFYIQEGDILSTASVKDNLKNAIKSKKYLWENGIIPYEFGDDFTCSEKTQILDAIKVIEEKTCIRFTENNNNQDTFIRFKKEKNGCFAPVGRLLGIEGPLPVNLQAPECFKNKGIIEHELLHVAGLFHEQSRPDRDDYVTIHWCNIQPYREKEFLKGSIHDMTTFDLPYDFNSIMHYPKFAFSRNGNPTITAKAVENRRGSSAQRNFVTNTTAATCELVRMALWLLIKLKYFNFNDYKSEEKILDLNPCKGYHLSDNPDMSLGQRESPSVNDIEKVNIMYNCKTRLM